MSMLQSILLGFTLQYITLTSYDIFKNIIQMTNIYNTIDMEEINNRVRKCQCYSQYS